MSDGDMCLQYVHWRTYIFNNIHQELYTSILPLYVVFLLCCIAEINTLWIFKHIFALGIDCNPWHWQSHLCLESSPELCTKFSAIKLSGQDVSTDVWCAKYHGNYKYLNQWSFCSFGNEEFFVLLQTKTTADRKKCYR